MRQNVTNRLIILQMGIRVCVFERLCRTCVRVCLFVLFYTGGGKKTWKNKRFESKQGIFKATSFRLTIQLTNDLPGHFYVCLEGN